MFGILVDVRNYHYTLGRIFKYNCLKFISIAINVLLFIKSEAYVRHNLWIYSYQSLNKNKVGDRSSNSLNGVGFENDKTSQYNDFALTELNIIPNEKETI